jgi:hypothetical protein
MTDDNYEAPLTTLLRRKLQHRWWSELLARPDATLHHGQTAPRVLILTAPLTPALAGSYFVWRTGCEAVVTICDGHEERDGTDDRREWPTSMRLPASIRGRRIDWTDYDATICIDGGYLSPKAQWGQIQGQLIQAMSDLYGLCGAAVR